MTAGRRSLHREDSDSHSPRSGSPTRDRSRTLHVSRSANSRRALSQCERRWKVHDDSNSLTLAGFAVAAAANEPSRPRQRGGSERRKLGVAVPAPVDRARRTAGKDGRERPHGLWSSGRHRHPGQRPRRELLRSRRACRPASPAKRTRSADGHRRRSRRPRRALQAVAISVDRSLEWGDEATGQHASNRDRRENARLPAERECRSHDGCEHERADEKRAPRPDSEIAT